VTISGSAERTSERVPEHAGAPGPAPLLVARGVTRAFNGNIANDDVDFSVRPGTVHALLGENGAGKTTLISILCGQYRADEGEILLEGRPLSLHSPRDGLRAGIGVVHQDFRLVQRFNVAENVILGTSQRPGRETERRVAEVAGELGFELDPRRVVAELSVGEQQQVEIVKVLYRGSRVLIFDEPTAVLTPQQAAQLFSALRELASRGKAVVFITHRLREVTEVADRVTVMRRGRVVADRDVADLTHQQLAELMVGEEVPARSPAGPGAPGPTVLELERLRCEGDGRRVLDEVDLVVHGGEIVGIAGVSGNGQRALAEVAAGIRRFERGVRRCAAASVAFVPEDRLATGLVASMSTADNLAFRRFQEPPLSSRVWLRRRRIEAFARELIERFRIPTQRPREPVGRLSGGGLQRVLLARELEEGPALIVASQPTRGLDVVSANAVRERLVAARDSGAGVLLISEDLDELIELSDCIAVILGGRIVAEFSRGEASRRELGLWMTGAGEQASSDPAAASGETA
jgi:simple sugar transport system ATP-binding protein